MTEQSAEEYRTYLKECDLLFQDIYGISYLVDSNGLGLTFASVCDVYLDASREAFLKDVSPRNFVVGEAEKIGLEEGDPELNRSRLAVIEFTLENDPEIRPDGCYVTMEDGTTLRLAANRYHGSGILFEASGGIGSESDFRVMARGRDISDAIEGSWGCVPTP